VILDSDFVIDVMLGKFDAIKRIEKLENSTEVLISTPTIFELFSGAIRSNKPEQEVTKIHNVLNRYKTLHLDINSAELAGRIEGKLIKKGQRMGKTDTLIAGIALRNQQPILTRNIKDFSRVKGLKIETY
jgi:predicted nucleic acid-binding protein|tara:strand:- start:786 stop:1175 length:390 start_codon:yes stop_codon:yes gene_type:complete